MNVIYFDFKQKNMETLSRFIDRNKYNYKKQATVSEETINKYSNLFKGQFPEELIWIWKNMGFGLYEDGYLQIVNPQEYDFAFDPGYLSGRTPIWNDVYDVTRSVIADFESQGGSAYVISGANGPIPPDYRRIAVRVSSTMTESGKPPYDYHFMYQTSDNRWAEQKGRGGLPNRLEPGQTPDDVEWQYRESFTQKDIPYDSDIVYIAVKNPISW